jgi:predicted TIM-barrel fold metal-dependent hydrolase
MEPRDDRLSRRQVLLGSARVAAAGTVLSGLHLSWSEEPEARAPADYVIWDAHGHLSPPGETPSDQIARVLRFADRMGIERVVVFMGYPWLMDPTPDELRQQNDQVMAAVTHSSGRAFGFVYLNPRHVEASLDELNRCVRDGPLVGVKLWVAARCREACLDSLVARAAELKAPVLQHTWSKITGNLPGESTAEDLAVLAERHPGAWFIAAHAGGDWETGIRAIRAHPQVLAEISGGDPTSGVVDMAARELGARRVLYGSDFPGRSFASQLAKVLGASITVEAKRLILAENLRRLLTPICSAKGIPL